MSVVDSSPAPLRGVWQTRVEASLQLGESPQAVLLTDLDSHLHFGEELLLLTERRLLYFSAQSPDAPAAWPLEDVAQIRVRDRHGVGLCEVHGTALRHAALRFTVPLAPAARWLVARFDQQKGLARDLLAVDPEVPEVEPREPTPNAATLFRLLAFARRRSGAMLLGFVLTLLTTAAGLIPPYLTMPLVDNVLVPYQKGSGQLADEAAVANVVWYLSGLFLAALAAWLLSWAQGIVLAWASERISADLRTQTYAHLQKLSLEYFNSKRTGDLVARISSDTDRICNFLSDGLTDFATDVFMIVGTSAILIWIDPFLALATLSTFPFIAGLIYWTRDRLQHGFIHGGRAWGDMTAILADTIPGIRVVKAFAQEHRELERFQEANNRILAANDRINTVWTFFWPLVALLNQLGLLVVWACGAWLIFKHEITFGVLTMFLTYIARFYTRIESMSRMVNATQRAAASAQRIFDILDCVPTVAEPARPLPLPQVRGEIEFRNVGFRYGHRRVIDDLTFSIRAGEVIGVVGSTGAGKSTLVNLVCRFYDATEGAILVDGMDVRSFAVADYRRHIGLVLQEPFLFYGTIAENVAYGRPQASRADILSAARAARAHEFILQLTDAYDSVVGERGQTLSGGERQRVSIARAILIDPRILILDEATSAVDNQTEREIQRALDNLIRGRTTIAIAHRLSTLRKADRLIVLERGRIIETGNHTELLARGGAYARLHHAQETGGVPVSDPLIPEPPPPVAGPTAPPEEWDLTRDVHGRLILSAHATSYGAVELVRCFPFTDPDGAVALSDPAGREVACLPALRDLSPARRKQWDRELAEREFLPVLLKIVRVVDGSDSAWWDVLTDRGPTGFPVVSDEQFRRLDANRVLIQDDVGLRYLVPDIKRLDAPSRRALRRYV